MAACLKKIISTAKAPAPVAPYNQAVVADRTVYVSGVLGMDVDTLKIVPGGVKAEAARALTNLGIILDAAGSKIDNVVKTTILLASINDYPSVNEEYKKVFLGNYPARTAFEVGKLPLGALVEIEAIALTGDVKIVST